ncbi:MAG: response regulator [Planctomycetes bacterium]|nr:response regulator [Planctomycetota bacterium]
MTRQKILLAERDVELLPILALHLRNEEYEVRCADTIAVALSAALLETPDLMVLNVHMPEADGVDVRAFLDHADRSKIPVICLAGEEQLRRRGRIRVEDLDNVAVIHKPVATSELLQSVKTTLDEERRQRHT